MLFRLLLSTIDLVLRYSHWGATVLACLYIILLVFNISPLLPDLVAPPDRSQPSTTVMLSFGAAMFSILAVAAWRQRVVRYSDDAPSVPAARLNEIASWLDRPLTLVEAHQIIYADSPDDLSMVAAIDTWYNNNANQSDQLWFYTTPEKDWEQLGGENGFAIVRDGNVVDFMMWWMN